MEDIEEDAMMRDKINIYKDKTKVRNAESISIAGNDEDLPDGPSLAEMLDELDLNDVEMKDVEKTNQ